MAVPARIEKFPADLRSGAIASPITPGIIAAVIRQMTAMVNTREKMVLPLLCGVVMIKSSLMFFPDDSSEDIPTSVLQLVEQLLQ